MVRKRIARLFRFKSSGKQEQAENNARIDRHLATLKACRRVLEKLDDYIVLDTAELSMDKGLARSALEEIMQDWRGTAYENSLRKFYLGLARCQPSVGREGVRSDRTDPVARRWRETVQREERALEARLDDDVIA